MNAISLRLITLISLTFIAACKKKENPAPPIVKEVPVTPIPIQQKVLIPVKLESDKLTIDLKYIQETGFLTQIETSDGIRELYSYNENKQLKEFDRYVKGDKVYAVYYIRDKQGNVIQANQNKVEYNGALMTPTGTYKIEYTPENKINKVTWYDNNNHILAESIRTYATSGAILKISTDGQKQAVYNYTFDDKNGWCKQIQLNQLISIESLNSLFLSSVGNITKLSEAGKVASETSYSYTYNSDNYPISWIQTDSKGAKTTFKITYR